MRDNLNGAFELFKQLSNEEPENIDYRLFLGKIALDMGERKVAKQEYKYLILLDPVNSEAYFGLAIVDYLEGKVKNAIKNAKQAKKLNPRNKRIEKFLMEIKPSTKEKTLVSVLKEREQQKITKPDKPKEKIVPPKKKEVKKKQKPKKLPTLQDKLQKIDKIREKINSKDYNKAEEKLNKYLTEKPDNLELIELKAELLNKMKNYKGTIQFCEEKLSKEPFKKSSKLSINLAIANSKLDDHETGIKILKDIIALEPENHRVWLELSNIYRRSGNEEETRKALNKATVLVTEKMTAKAKFSK